MAVRICENLKGFANRRSSELVVAVQRGGRDDVHGGVGRAARQRSAERGLHLGIRRGVVGRDERPGQALKRRRHIHADPRHAIRAQQLDLGQKRCLEPTHVHTLDRADRIRDGD